MKPIFQGKNTLQSQGYVNKDKYNKNLHLILNKSHQEKVKDEM